MDEELNVEISLEQVRQLIGQVFGVSVDEVTKLNGYDDQNFLCHVIDSGAVSINGSLVVFKITNPIETAETNLLGNLKN